MFIYQVLGLFLFGLIDCKINESVKGGNHGIKVNRFVSPSKARVVELPRPVIISEPAPIQQRYVFERLSEINNIPQQKEEIRIEHNQLIESRNKQKNDQEFIVHKEERNEVNQNYQQDHQLQIVQQIQQELQHQKQYEQLIQKQQKENCDEKEKIIQQSKTNEKIEQIVQQKQELNQKLTEEEEAIAEPFPLIPKTNFTCDDKPILPGMYADLETGCRVYHFCFAKPEKAPIVQIAQNQQIKEDLTDNFDNSINEFQPEQQQLKSFFCGEGTLFNQKLLICDHIANVICAESSRYYSANSEFGKPSAEPALNKNQQQNKVSKINEKIVQKHETFEPVIQIKEPEPSRIIQEPIKQEISQIREEIKQECIGCKKNSENFITKNKVTTSSINSNDWSKNLSWNTKRTYWGSVSDSNQSSKSSQLKSIKSSNINRRFLGEQMFENIPQTGFTCENKPFENGMYADLQTGCKIYHQCFNGRKSTFLCSRGTLFNQKLLSCDFEEKVKCSDSEQYYTFNNEFN